MSKKVKFINSLGKELEINDSAPFLLIKFDTTTNVNIYSNKSINQDGETYNGNTLDKMDISLVLELISDNEHELIGLRRNIISTFNPKLNEGYIIYEDDIKKYEAKCIVNKVPYFSPSDNETFQSCLISITASQPFWNNLDLSEEEIVTWIGGMSYPFSFPISFATKGETKTNIINEGDVETPLEITFRGPASNPKITNLLTGDFIRVKKNLTADDTLVINTEFGKKKVEIIGKDEIKLNAFNYIDLNSTFFQLQLGDNVLEYSSDNGVDPASVSIKYRNRYLGI